MGLLDFLKGKKQPEAESPKVEQSKADKKKLKSKPTKSSLAPKKAKKPAIAPSLPKEPLDKKFKVKKSSPKKVTVKESLPSDQEKPEKKSWFSRLKDGLGKSAEKITSGLAITIGKPKLEASDLESIEDALIMADLGVEAALRLTEGLKKRSFPDGVTEESLAEALADEVAKILAPIATPLELNPALKPHVILMVGVNGSGKTTTAGKLAEYWQSQGKTVMLAAADTFRAAAVEQLQIWGERTGTKVVTGAQGSDAAAVAYLAYEKALEDGADLLIIDTAGRLQAKVELMDELAKICRVVSKLEADAPHDRIIVLDGTVGQNALSQVLAFQETAGLTGMIVTKLDGSARGGVVVGLAENFGLPIHAVGVGEGKDDLRAFDAIEFGRALAGLDIDSGKA